MLPIFIDVEASSFAGDSYPIEIAWNMPEVEIENHLLNPYCIKEWIDWDPASQAVHGLSRSYLSDHGEAPLIVAKRMNKILSGAEVYSDAAEYDVHWIDQLFKATGMVREFHVRDFFSLLPDEITNGYYMNNSSLLSRYKEKARKRAGVPAHRANHDVKYLIELYMLTVMHY